jgi:TRAP-type C4-dicarboxylate transport system permease large subunit
MLARDVFSSFSNYSLTVIPMFIFMGSLAFATGMSRKLYDSSHRIFGQMRGGLVIATIAACAGFAAICGSTNATAAAMGRVALPEMKRYNYDDSLATGSVAAAGSLGILIPPSTISWFTVSLPVNPSAPFSYLESCQVCYWLFFLLQ